MPTDDAPVAIVAGGGALPAKVAQALVRAGRAPFIIALADEAGSEIEAHPHIRLSLGEVGRFFAELERRGIRDLILVGRVTRPDIGALRFDFGAVKSLPGLLGLARGGDDSLLTGIVRMLEARGYRVRGAHEVAPDLVLAPGPLTRRRPNEAETADIATGLAVLAAMSAFDIGQAVVVAAGRVLAVEAAEGTDAMLARIAGLRASGRLKLSGRGGILVKAPKRGQDLRVDMPTVGAETARLVGEAGLAGMAVAAGVVLVPDVDAFRRAADVAGLFVIATAGA